MLESGNRIDMDILKTSLDTPHDSHQRVVESVQVDTPDLSRYDCLYDFQVSTEHNTPKENVHA